MIACPDKKCQFLVGNSRAVKRVGRVRRILDDSGMGADRAGIEQGENLSADDLIKIAEKRADAVRSLGPNPMKGDR